MRATLEAAAAPHLRHLDNFNFNLSESLVCGKEITGRIKEQRNAMLLGSAQCNAFITDMDIARHTDD